MAAEAGFLDLVKLMTAETVEVVVMDNSMSSSETRSVVHAAPRGRNIDVLEVILKKEPKLTYLKDGDGTTALSYAILVGYLDGVHYLLEKFSVTSYQRDGSDGNTPLHLAAIDGHNRCMHALAWDKRVSVNLSNHDGMTALDVVEEQMETEVSFPKQRITWLILQPSATRKTIRPELKPESPTTKKYRNNMVNTLLLVSILVTTVTFSAGFTLPGGYNNSYPHEGMATLVTRLSFQIFLISNTIALYSSIIAAVNLLTIARDFNPFPCIICRPYVWAITVDRLNQPRSVSFGH
ncbi:hypothetical protein ACSBR2_030608 [Camellia fascicularis]